jgi:hypothetical protein
MSREPSLSSHQSFRDALAGPSMCPRPPALHQTIVARAHAVTAAPSRSSSLPTLAPRRESIFEQSACAVRGAKRAPFRATSSRVRVSSRVKSVSQRDAQQTRVRADLRRRAPHPVRAEGVEPSGSLPGYRTHVVFDQVRGRRRGATRSGSTDDHPVASPSRRSWPAHDVK